MISAWWQQSLKHRCPILMVDRVEISVLSLRVWGKQKASEEAATESNEILSSVSGASESFCLLWTLEPNLGLFLGFISRGYRVI